MEKGLPENSAKIEGFVRLPDNTGKFRIVIMNWYNNRQTADGKGVESVRIAPGEYEVIDVRLYRTDENNDVWSTRTILPMGISISPGETVDIPGVKGPDKAYVSTVNWSPEYYNFSFFMEDKNKNRYGYFRKNDSLIKSPGFVVENADGEILFRESFHPG
jgi:hypothetical protein